MRPEVQGLELVWDRASLCSVTVTTFLTVESDPKLLEQKLEDQTKLALFSAYFSPSPVADRGCWSRWDPGTDRGLMCCLCKLLLLHFDVASAASSFCPSQPTSISSSSILALCWNCSTGPCGLLVCVERWPAVEWLWSEIWAALGSLFKEASAMATGATATPPRLP